MIIEISCASKCEYMYFLDCHKYKMIKFNQKLCFIGISLKLFFSLWIYIIQCYVKTDSEFLLLIKVLAISEPTNFFHQGGLLAGIVGGMIQSAFVNLL